MMKIKMLALAGLALLLAGCVTAEELRAEDERTCFGYGFRAHTDAFADCLLRLDLDRRTEGRSLRDHASRLDERA